MRMNRDVTSKCSMPSSFIAEDASRPNRNGWGCDCLSAVSTGRLHPSRGFHVRPINQVFSPGAYRGSKPQGILISEQASRLDAFSGYPFRT